MNILTKAATFDLLADNMAMFEALEDTGKITWASRTLERMFGYSRPGDLEGRAIEVLVPDAVKERHVSVHRPHFSADPSPRLMGRKETIKGQRQDGSLFPAEVMLFPKSENLTRIIVGVVFDMTPRS